MKIATTNRSSTATRIFVCLTNLVSAYLLFLMNMYVGSGILVVSACILLYVAVRRHKVIWEITEHGRVFSILRNHKLLFEGRSMELSSVNEKEHYYDIHPCVGRMIRIPKIASNDSLLHLIRSKK